MQTLSIFLKSFASKIIKFDLKLSIRFSKDEEFGIAKILSFEHIHASIT